MTSPFNDSGEVLGSIVTWNLYGAKVHISKVRKALADAGLDTDVAPDLRNSSAFTRAKKELEENRSIDKVSTTKDGKVTFQLTRKHLDESTCKMEFDYETVVTLDKETGDITCDDYLIEQTARDLFNDALNHRTTSDITAMVQALFKKNADLWPINRKKGVAYFVPQQFADYQAKVDAFLRECGGSLEPWPIYKTGEKIVRETVRDGFNQMIEELEGLADSWDDKTRTSTMNKAIDEFIQIKHKFESYSETLGAFKEGLDEKLKEVKQKIVAKAKAKAEGGVEQEAVAA